MIANIIKKNKYFLLSQIPTVLVFVLLFFVLIIVGASNNDRLYAFATEPSPVDISASYQFDDPKFFDAFPVWFDKVNKTYYDSSLSSWYNVFGFHINLLNNSDYIAGKLVYSSVFVLAFHSFYDLKNDEAYLYGKSLLNSGFETNTYLNFSSLSQNNQTTPINLRIKGYLVTLPSFLPSYLVEGYDSFIIVSTSILKEYFSSCQYIDEAVGLTPFSAFVFTSSFKADFAIKEKTEEFMDEIQHFLNTTLETFDLPHIILLWSFDPFFERIDNLFSVIRSDMIFYTYATLPIALLTVLSIYQSHDQTFKSFELFIMKLHERGYKKPKILLLFFNTFFSFNIVLLIIAFMLITALSFILHFEFVRILSFSSYFFISWLIIVQYLQFKFFKNNLENFYQSLVPPEEKRVKRTSLKYHFIDFLFKLLIFSSSLAIIVIIHHLFTFSSLLYYSLLGVFAFLMILSFTPFIEELLVFLINGFFLLAMKKFATKLFGRIRIILYKLFVTRTKHSRYHHISLMLLFILSPAILMTFDSFHFQFQVLHYSSLCGDLVLEDLDSYSFNNISNILGPKDIIVPAIKVKSSSGITFYFSDPYNFSLLMDYTWRRSYPYLQANHETFDAFISLTNNTSSIIISQSVAKYYNISKGNTLSLFVPKSLNLVVFPSNITMLNYTISAICSDVPYLDTKEEFWAFASGKFYNRELNETTFNFDAGTSEIFFNSSLISTAFLRVFDAETITNIINLITTYYPFVSYKILGSKEAIDALYPVPATRFRQLTMLQVMVANLLIVSFFAILVVTTIDFKKRPIVQLFSRGTRIKDITNSFLLYIFIQISVFLLLGLPFAIGLAKIFILVLGAEIGQTAINLKIQLGSLLFLLCYILLLGIVDMWIGSFRIKKLIKESKIIIGEGNE